MPVAFLTTTEVADALKVSPDTIRLMCRNGQLGVKYNDDYFIHPDQFERLKKSDDRPGNKPGPKPKRADILLVLRLLRSGKNANQIVKLTKMSRAKVYRIKKDREEAEEALRLHAELIRATTGS